MKRAIQETYRRMGRAEHAVAPKSRKKKSSKQLDAEIAEALNKPTAQQVEIAIRSALRDPRVSKSAWQRGLDALEIAELSLRRAGFAVTLSGRADPDEIEVDDYNLKIKL